MANFALSSVSVRSLKTALRDRFPSVKSSHLSEAIAATAGFRSHAALLAYTQSTVSVPIVFLTDKPFVQRLHELGYPDIQPFEFSSIWLGGSGVPDEGRNLIARLLKLEERPHGNYPIIYALRSQCETLFGKTLGIGYPKPVDDDTHMVVRLERGVDHKACLIGWGNSVNASYPSFDFPGSDHQVRFYERLPLPNGRYVEYCSAVISMPYKGSSKMTELPAARALAEQVGWQCIELPDWTWYSAHATTLILFRRTTTHEEMLQIWPTSFKRWLIENKSRLLKGARMERRHVVNDAIKCQHLPLDVRTWEQLRERYLKEFAPSMYHFDDGSMARAFKRVFDKWLAEHG